MQKNILKFTLLDTIILSKPIRKNKFYDEFKYLFFNYIFWGADRSL